MGKNKDEEWIGLIFGVRGVTFPIEWRVIAHRWRGDNRLVLRLQHTQDGTTHEQYYDDLNFDCMDGYLYVRVDRLLQGRKKPKRLTEGVSVEAYLESRGVAV